MNAAGWWEYQWWATFGAGRAERQLHRHVGRLRPARILELQMAGIDQAVRLIRSARRFQPELPLRYTAVDQFDARPGNPLLLRTVHKGLQGLCDAQVRLLPVDHAPALLTYANLIGPVDLLLVSADLSRPPWAGVGRYLPYVTGGATQVLVWDEGRYRACSTGDLFPTLGAGPRRQAA